jgi:ribosomal protein L19
VTSILDEIVADQIRTDLPELAPGDTVRVSVKVKEGNRERIQVFEGTVMRLRGVGRGDRAHQHPKRHPSRDAARAAPDRRL